MLIKERIADEGVSVEALESLLSRARRALRESLAGLMAQGDEA